jgi:hypothetical protein
VYRTFHKGTKSNIQILHIKIHDKDCFDGPYLLFVNIKHNGKSHIKTNLFYIEPNNVICHSRAKISFLVHTSALIPKNHNHHMQCNVEYYNLYNVSKLTNQYCGPVTFYNNFILHI